MSKRYLGEPAFVTLAGAIKKTAVDRVGIGSYGLLKYGANPHYFSYEEALGAEAELVRARIESEEVSVRETRELTEYANRLVTDEYRAEVLAQKLERGPQLMGMIPAEQYEVDPVFPTDYFEPGTIVYGMVTPRAHYTMSPGWRPRPYFLLKMKVTEASFAPAHQGALYYRFKDTHFHLPTAWLFAKLKEARATLVARFAEETGGSILPENIQVFTTKQEKAWEDAQMSELIAAHRRGN